MIITTNPIVDAPKGMEMFRQTSFYKTRFSTVLVVDDDVDSFRILDKAFEKYSSNILYGRNLFQGLNLLSNHSVDLICLDWKLGEVTGGDFLKLIERHSTELLHGRPFPVYVTWSALSAKACHGPLSTEIFHLDHWQKPLSVKTLERNIESLHKIIF